MAIVKVDGLFTPLKRHRVDDFKNSPKRCRPYRARGKTSHREDHNSPLDHDLVKLSENLRRGKRIDVTSQFSMRHVGNVNSTAGRSFSPPQSKDNSIDSKEDQNTNSSINQGLRKRQSSSDQHRPGRTTENMVANCNSKNSHSVLGRKSRLFSEYVPLGLTSQKSKEVEYNDRKVMEAVDAYEDVLTKSKAKNCKGASTAAMELRKQGKWVNNMNQVGSVRGVKVGDKFRHRGDRAQLTIIGLHRQLTSGIDYMRRNDGKILATSTVDSRRGYVNHLQSSDVLIYSGQGVNSLFKTKPKNQMEGGNLVMQGGNLALKNSKEEGTPSWFIRKHSNGSYYVYYGLYIVERDLQEKESSGMIYKFRHLDH